MAGDEKEERRKYIEKCVNSVAGSEKGGVPLRGFERDYITFADPAGVPYRELGYSSCLDMLLHMPSAVSIQRGPLGEQMVVACSNAANSRLLSLVGGQKTSKKVSKLKKRKKNAMQRDASYYQGQGRRPNPSFGGYHSPGPKIIAPRFARMQAATRGFNQYPSSSPFGQPFHRSQPPPMRTNTFGQPPQGHAARQTFKPYTPPSMRPETPAPAPVVEPQAPPPTNLPVVKVSTDVLMQRILEIVKSRPHGLFSTRLPFEYQTRYKEAAPEDIGSVAIKDMTSCIRVESPVENRVILYAKVDASLPSGAPKKAQPPQKAQSDVPQAKTNGVQPSKPTVKQDFTTDPLPDIGENLLAFISHVESVDNFYIQAADSPIEDLGLELQTYFLYPPSGQTMSPKSGDCCAALYDNDNSWYRAKILSVIDRPTRGTTKTEPQTETMCRVLFVDYGNREKVPVSKIRSLPDSFCALPKQAIHCGLDGVVPLNKIKHSEDVVEHFHKLVEDKECVLTIKEYNGAVTLVDLDNGETKNVSRKLIKDKYVLGAPDYMSDSTPHESSSDTESVCESAEQVSSPRFFSRLESLSLDETESIQGKYLVVPEVDYLDIRVTNVNSTDDFTFVLAGSDHEDAIIALEKKMLSCYGDKEKYQVDSVRMGGYYAVCADDCWYRATVKLVQHGEFIIELLDHGQVLKVTQQDLRQLLNCFLKLPFQGIAGSLLGAGSLTGERVCDAFQEMALTQEFVATVVERPLPSNSMRFVVELIDSNSTEDVNVNDVLAAKAATVSEMQPTFPERNSTKQAFLSHISSNGTFYLRFPGPGLLRSEALMDEIQEHFKKGGMKASEFISKPQVGDLVWARYSKDTFWYRSKVNSVDRGKREVTITFVDYGNEDVVKISCLRRPLDETELQSVPHQAVKCRLADWPSSLEHVWEENFGEQLVDRLQDEPFEIEVVGDTNEAGVPNVRFYQKTEEGRTLYKDELLQLLQADGTISSVIAPAEKTKDIALPMSPSLPPVTKALPSSSFTPHISESLRLNGEWLQAVIAHVSSPSSFSIQLLSSYEAIEQLKVDMATYYESVEEEEDCCEGHVGMECAVYDIDGDWCRAIVQRCNPEGILLFYADWGMARLVAQRKLRPLPEQFKKLPYQGILCSLAGISCKSPSDWSSKAIRRLIELVREPSSFVVKIVAFKPCKEELPLKMKIPELDFYDTRYGRDVCLNDIMVAEGYAVKTF